MSTIRIEFQTDNAAFRGEEDQLCLNEVEDVLREAIRKLIPVRDLGFANLHDSNGNTIGLIQIEED